MKTLIPILQALAGIALLVRGILLFIKLSAVKEHSILPNKTAQVVLDKPGKYNVFLLRSFEWKLATGLTIFNNAKVELFSENNTPIAFRKSSPFTLNQGKSGGTSYILMGTFSNEMPNATINILFTTPANNSKLMIKHSSNSDKLLAIISCVIGFMLTIAALFTYMIFKGIMK